jgi:mRNA interferase MazF
MVVVINRFEVWLVNLDPTIGSEIKKTRPCLIISPNEANIYLDTVIASPMTTILRKYPTRVNCSFQKKKGQVAIDQLRTLDKKRLVKKLGKLDIATCRKICTTLQSFFAFE